MNQGTDAPGDGKCPEDCLNLMNKPGDHCDVGHPDHAPAGNHYQHGDHCFPGSPQDAGYAVGV